MPSSSTVVKRFSSVWSSYETLFDYDIKREETTRIEARMASPGFWDNQEKAQEFVGQLKTLRAIVAPLEKSLAEGADLQAMLEMAEEDDSFAGEVRSEIERLEDALEDLELKALLNGPHDAAGAIMSFHARDGGTDANDWAEMLMRMYSQWAQKNDYSVDLLDRLDNDEGGIRWATIAVHGPMAYGYLKGEHGIHRLVRISPYNSEGKRQTSFAAVKVTPEIADNFKVEINEEDVRTDTFRASGAGGQHVNKTDSAIRLTHIPTNTVVQCQNERSQHKNRATAWKMLRAELARQEDERREEEQYKQYQTQAKTGFGAQIRNYFLHPDQRVKDSRTGESAGNFHTVLDGDIQNFLDAYLRWRVKKEG
nr:peptide chain release factor 2 [Lignipirellula cremea]